MSEMQHAQQREANTRNRSVVRVAIVAATIAVAAVGAAIVFTRGGGDAPTADKVVATLRVDGEANGLAVGEDALWVALNTFPSLEGTLQRVNLVSGHPAPERLRLGRGQRGLA